MDTDWGPNFLCHQCFVKPFGGQMTSFKTANELSRYIEGQLDVPTPSRSLWRHCNDSLAPEVTRTYIHQPHGGHPIVMVMVGKDWLTHILLHVSWPLLSWGMCINLTSDFRSHVNGCGQRWRSRSRPSIQSIYLRFVSHPLNHSFLRYSYFNILSLTIQSQDDGFCQRSKLHTCSWHPVDVLPVRFTSIRATIT